METILSSVIAAAVTLFFVRRHVKSLPAGKAGPSAAQRKRAGSGAGAPASARKSPSSEAA